MRDLADSLKQLFLLEDFLNQLEKLEEFLTEKNIREFCLSPGENNYSLLTVAIANKHPLVDKLLVAMEQFLSPEERVVALNHNFISHDSRAMYVGMTPLRAALTINSDQDVLKILTFVRKLPFEMGKQLFSQVVEVFSCVHETCYFNYETGRILRDVSSEVLERNKFSGSLLEMAIALNNENVLNLFVDTATYFELAPIANKIMEHRKQRIVNAHSNGAEHIASEALSELALLEKMKLENLREVRDFNAVREALSVKMGCFPEQVPTDEIQRIIMVSRHSALGEVALWRNDDPAEGVVVVTPSVRGYMAPSEQPLPPQRQVSNRYRLLSPVPRSGMTVVSDEEEMKEMFRND